MSWMIALATGCWPPCDSSGDGGDGGSRSGGDGGGDSAAGQREERGCAEGEGEEFGGPGSGSAVDLDRRKGLSRDSRPICHGGNYREVATGRKKKFWG